MKALALARIWSRSSAKLEFDRLSLEPLQEVADVRTFELAERHHIVAADRKDRRLPSFGKQKRVTPRCILGTCACVGPGNQEARAVGVRTKAIENSLGSFLARQRRVDAERGERKHGMLGVGQPQAVGEPGGILFHEHRKRREPKRRVWRQGVGLFDRDQNFSSGQVAARRQALWSAAPGRRVLRRRRSRQAR